MYQLKILSPRAASIPVISIGNIAFGGTGKTPLAMQLLARLQKNGFKPALISRGYRGKWEHRQEILSDGNKLLGSWREAGDEPFMVAQNNPSAGVFIGKNRFASVRTATQMGFDIAVLDDGFQHRRLNRDIDIVLYDPSEKVSLRESRTALKRSHIILVKKKQINSIQYLKTKNPRSNFFPYQVISSGLFSLHNNIEYSAAELQNKRILGCSGIAHPQRFRESLSKLGLTPEAMLRFPDHFSYPPHSLKKILAQYEQSRAEALIITEKDKVKLQEKEELHSFPVYYLKIDLQIDPQFYETVLTLPAIKKYKNE